MAGGSRSGSHSLRPFVYVFQALFMFRNEKQNFIKSYEVFLVYWYILKICSGD